MPDRPHILQFPVAGRALPPERLRLEDALDRYAYTSPVVYDALLCVATLWARDAAPADAGAALALAYWFRRAVVSDRVVARTAEEDALAAERSDARRLIERARAELRSRALLVDALAAEQPPPRDAMQRRPLDASMAERIEAADPFQPARLARSGAYVAHHDAGPLLDDALARRHEIAPELAHVDDGALRELLVASFRESIDEDAAAETRARLDLARTP